MTERSPAGLRARRWRRAVTLTLAGITALVIGWAVRDAMRVRASLGSLRTALAPAAEAASSLDVVKLRTIVAAAEAPAEAAAAAARSWALDVTGRVPIAGRSVRALRSLAGAARDAVTGAEALLDATAAFPSRGGRLDYALRDGRIDLRPWIRAAPAAAAALQAIESAEARLASAPSALVVPTLSAARHQGQAQIARLLGAARALDDGARLIPSMLGGSGPRRYLVVLQNLSEARATGGIPAGTVLFETDRGRLRLRDVASNLDVVEARDDIAAPAWFRRRYDHLAARRLWVNANVEADFRVSGPSMVELFREITSERVDGIIAIDPLALREMLEVTGPVVGPRGIRVTAERVAPLILSEEYEIFPQHAHRERKEFFEALAAVIWDRVASSADVERTAEAMGRAARGKHVLLWSAHADEQEVFERAGLAGSVGVTPSGPAIAAITQSGSANKMDYYLRRSITLDVRPRSDGFVDARLVVLLRNGGPSKGLPAYVLGPDPTAPSYSPGYIRTYLSVYVPPDAVVLGMRSDDDDVWYESQLAPHAMIISNFVTVLPGRQRRVVLDVRFRAPKRGEQAFDLVLQKQPTVVPDDVTVTVRNSGPPAFDAQADGDVLVRVPPGRGRLRRLADLLAAVP